MMPEEIVCGVCGRSFNPDNLDQVLYHETHQLMLVSSAGQGVQVGPCYVCGHAARCEVLLGQSFKPHGVCDWSPSRFKSRYCFEFTEAMKKAWEKSGEIVRDAIQKTIEEGEDDGQGSGTPEAPRKKS